MNCVFVYKDGTVGLRVLPPDHVKLPVFRIAIHQPLRFKDVEMEMLLTTTVEEYTRQGTMFDGRAIFCASGFKVMEYARTRFVTEVELVQHADSETRIAGDMFRQVRDGILNAYHDPIELDRKFGPVPGPLYFKYDGLVQLVARKKIAVRS